MKWLHEFARAQFSRYFSQLYEQISTLKANYVPPLGILEQPEATGGSHVSSDREGHR